LNSDPVNKEPATRIASRFRNVAIGADDLESLAALFCVPDLSDRLAAVNEKIIDTVQDTSLRAYEPEFSSSFAAIAGNGGKRLRPLFTIICAAGGGVFDERVVAAAAAVELVQVGSLVHDDILDAAETRRGLPTVNAAMGSDYAIIFGDYILGRAGELAASVSQEAAGLISGTFVNLCEAQALEMRDAYNPDRSIESYLATIDGKTAALFDCACRLGAHCGGLPRDRAEALGHFGNTFGVSFQILDDILDLVGDADKLGKPTGNDIKSGVYTLPVIKTLAESPAARSLLVPPVGDSLANKNDGVASVYSTALVEEVRSSQHIPGALDEVLRLNEKARRAAENVEMLSVGAGLAAFPDAYVHWAIDNFVDPSLRATFNPTFGVANPQAK